MNTAAAATTISSAVSGAVALICLVAVALMWTVGDKHFPRVIAMLTLTGFAGLIGTPVGGWLQRGLEWSYEFFGRLTGRWISPTIGAVTVATVCAIAVIYVLVVHLKKKTLDRKTMTSAAVVPFTVTAIPGPLGAAALTLITGVTGLIGSGITAAFGWG